MYVYLEPCKRLINHSVKRVKHFEFNIDLEEADAPRSQAYHGNIFVYIFCVLRIHSRVNKGHNHYKVACNPLYIIWQMDL